MATWDLLSQTATTHLESRFLVLGIRTKSGCVLRQSTLGRGSKYWIGKHAPSMRPKRHYNPGQEERNTEPDRGMNLRVVNNETVDYNCIGNQDVGKCYTKKSDDITHEPR
ncbi:hypothetical protein RF11_06518 [Thelohanellus kitauei]|uniref:Uncharacterized protein n=1 Tax=Thelohanellus kitauei TaxID=669202 RepID=A0A0C2J5F7_THEKT|nr:hypothetical protein RF11_06518 [Thelohanellus kitauei]